MVLMGFILMFFMFSGYGKLGRRKWRTTLMKKGGHDYLKGGPLLEVGLLLLCVCFGQLFYLLLVENVI
jgi:hypothetical protein